MTVSEAGRRFAFARGWVLVGGDGAVVEVRHPRRDHSMLLGEDPGAPEAVMHEPSYRWGKGFVITDAASYRFDRPSALSWFPEGVRVEYALGALRLRARRQIGDCWTESYELSNESREPVTVGSLAVSTPWRDVYFSAVDSLRRAVHAHVWTGGSDSWVWAAPMDGTGPGLGLVVTEGGLEAYSVESRDTVTSSNVRGHLYLHVTDYARAPHAMGGQRPIELEPGEVYRWGWRLGWYADLAALHTARRGWRLPLVDADDLAVEIGEVLPLQTTPGAELSEPNPVAATAAGLRNVWAVDGDRRSRVAVLVHPPLRAVVEQRVRFVLNHQRAVERADGRAAAFVPYDTEWGLTVLPGSWGDWSDTRERVGTARLLQEARNLGWGDARELDDALAAYERFVCNFVVADDGTVADDSRRPERVRLYNFPWYARFLLDRGRLDRAVGILDAYYSGGGSRFLAFELGPVLRDLADKLEARGRAADAQRMLDHLTGHARTFLRYGEDLPAHEVNYEQSMVAPLLELLLAARQIDPGLVPDAELLRRLAWLRAFAADQPDVRLRHVPIRHWDGYWFGRLRLWGDVFPHYWSALSAAVYMDWPEEVGDPGLAAALDRQGHALLQSLLTGFFSDGSATCAFVYPSCVDGRPAHVADPLANDQDWALVYAMRHGLR